MWPFSCISLLFFNKTPVCLSALFLPFLPPPCPLCEADGPACRGGLTRHPHAAKEEPDVLCHGTLRCTDSPDRDLSWEGTMYLNFSFNQQHYLFGLLAFDPLRTQSRSGLSFVIYYIVTYTYLTVKNAVLLIFRMWKWFPRKKNTKDLGSVCLLQNNPQKNNWLWSEG